MSIIDDYQKHTLTTAIYPDSSKGTSTAKSYTFQGLASECGELLTANSYDDKLKEFGDILWYLARICDEVKFIKFKELTDIRTNPSYEIIPSQMTVGLSQIADAFKKEMRDGLPRDPEALRKYRNKIEFGMITVFNSCLSYIMHCAEDEGDERSEKAILCLCMDKNMAKLSDRKSRSKLEGSGDDR